MAEGLSVCQVMIDSDCEDEGTWQNDFSSGCVWSGLGWTWLWHLGEYSVAHEV